MSNDWATSGPDLLLEISGPGRRRGLEEALREAIRTGRLSAGARLPSSRALAAELGLARNTVADAYAQLVAEGFLLARRGSGTRVAERRPAAPRRRPAVADQPRRRRPYDLVPGRPDLTGFPRSAWLAASRRVLAEAPASDLDYPDPRGLPALRTQLADYLARVRGVRAAPEQVVVCSGFGQALSLLSGVLAEQGGTRLAVEAYGVDHHREIACAAGLSAQPLPVDDQGADIGRLADQAAVLLTAAHQFPLGIALSAARRDAAVRWAATTGGLVIEDDYDGEFRYDRRPLGAVQGLAPDRVAYVGTASKSLAPGVHLGWLVVPPAMIEPVVRAKRLTDGFTGILEQLTLAELIRSGAYDRHVRRSRLRYRRRRDRLVQVLGQRHPDVTVTGIAAGLHAVITMGGGLRAADEPALVSRAARAGLGLLGLDEHRFRSDRGAPAALVIGYGTPPEHSYGRALELLCQVLPGGA